MAGIHDMEQLRFGDTQHFELQPQGTDAHPDPETSCTSNYDMPGDMEQDLQHIYNNYNALQEMVDIQRPVVLNPEVLMCGINLHLEPQLTFSLDGFKIEYLDSDSGQDGDLVTLFWEVSDIISIDCKWIQMVQSALITLHVSSSAETVNSGPVKVEFCLADPQWEWKQQKIWQLDSRYQEVWKNIQSDDLASQNWSTEPSLCFPKQYFHGIDDFEDVIYPEGDRDAVSISSRDVELLLPEIFVNDTIIDFYIKYLTQRIEPTARRRYHFFSSFFFRKLADLDKDQENAPKGREAFLRVRKWTRKIDVFAKEFLFIPVNFSLHWSLLVICYPGEVDTFKDGDARIAGKLPCIMHMNSIKGTHTGLKDIIQSYLWEEWKERHPESTSDSSDKFLNLRFLSLELPQQDNLFDCGLFLLHYVERFLMDAPSFFNPMKIDVFSSFLGDDWFVPAEASLKRSLIRKLIHELVTEPSKTYPKLICGDEKHDERHHRTENAVGEPSRELLRQGCFAAEPDSVCRILGAHQQSKLTCLNDSEKGLSVPGCTLETGGVSMLAQQEIQMCPLDDDIIVCSPSQDAKNEPFFAYSVNQLDPKSCAPEDAEEFKGSCSVIKDKNNHQESLLDSLDSNQKISSHAEVEVHEHDIMVFKCCPFSDNVNKVMAGQASRNEIEYGRCEASQDMDSVMMLDASKHDTGTGQKSTEGKADNGRCDLSQDTDCFATGCMKTDGAERSFERNIVKDMDDVCDLSEDARSVMIDDMNNVVAECLSERSTVEVVDPGAVEDDTKAEKTSTIAGTIDDSEQYGSSESKDGNSGSIMSSGSTISCGLKEGNVAGDTTNGTGETHADGEDDCHNLATGEVAPCEDDTTCTDAEMPHVKGISTCSSKDGTYSEKATSNARRPLLGSTSEDKSILVSDDMCLLKGVQCTEDVIIKGSTMEETSTILDKINDSMQYASSELRDGNTNNPVAGESTQGSDVDGLELAAFPCECGTDAEMLPPHVDGTCSAEDENNSMYNSVCEIKKMQVSEEFRSTSEDDIIEGSTKEETSTVPGNNNDSTQDASSELRDANTDNAVSGQSTQGSDVDGHELAAFPCEGGTDAEMLPPHVDGACSVEDENNSISDSVREAKKMQVSGEFWSTSEGDIIEGSTKEETSTIPDKNNDITHDASSELRDANTDNTIAGESTHGTEADDHELTAFPCEGGTDAEILPHVDGTCSVEGESNSISGSICEAKKMQVSEEFLSTSEDDIIEGSTGSGSEHHVLSEAKNEKCHVGVKRMFPDSSICEAKKMQISEDFRSTSEDDIIEGSTGSGSEQHVLSEAKNEKCRVGAKRMFPDSSICEAKKMQISEDFRSTSEDDIIEGSTKKETDTAAGKMNGSEQYASSELEDGNPDRASSGSEQHDVSSEVKNEKCCVGAKRLFPDSSICEAKETVTLDDKFWQKYSSKGAEARFGRRYKRRILCKRRKVISWTLPYSLESSDSD